MPESRKEDIVVQELNDEVLIYDLKINKAFCLNHTSALVWQLCNGKNSVSDIGRQLSKQLKSPVTEDFVFFALDQLKKENLLLSGQKIETRFAGLSRREVIRKVGLASFAALPVIASLVAPTAVSALSACSCVNPGNCLTQTSCPSTVNCNGSKQCAP